MLVELRGIVPITAEQSPIPVIIPQVLELGGPKVDLLLF